MDEVVFRGFLRFLEPMLMDTVIDLYGEYVPRLARSARYYLGLDGHLAAWRRRAREFLVNVILFQEPIEGGYLMIAGDGKSVEEIPAVDPPAIKHLLEGEHVRTGSAFRNKIYRTGRASRDWEGMINQVLLDNGRGNEIKRRVRQVVVE